MNILLISDDIRAHSGVANIASELAKGLNTKGHTVVNIGASQITTTPPVYYRYDTGQEAVVVPSNSYQDVGLILRSITDYTIDVLVLITDPNKFEQVWMQARRIKALVPIVYLNVWDTNLLPHPDGKAHYNEWVYESCSALACISKQTENFCKEIVGRLPAHQRPLVTYVPHGLDSSVFKPLPDHEIAEFKKMFYGGHDFKFVAFFNSRNMGRKKPADLIYGFQMFLDALPEAERDKVGLLLHTEIVGHAMGSTDLMAVAKSLAPKAKICIHAEDLPPSELNKFYNASDVVFNVSNAEGWGLTVTEAMLAGRPIAATVTGGLQDQMNFTDATGKPMQFDSTFTSNSDGHLTRHGEWVYPLYPVCKEIIGSPATPYLFNDVVSHNQIKDALLYWYHMDKAERNRRGAKGREYCLTSGLNSAAMVETFEQTLLQTATNYSKPPAFNLYHA